MKNRINFDDEQKQELVNRIRIEVLKFGIEKVHVLTIPPHVKTNATTLNTKNQTSRPKV
jgi:hypothetical protein